MESFLSAYGQKIGYLIVLVGSFFEGESVVLTAGFLSFTNFFSLPVVMFIAFAGSVSADQLLFFIGRRYGPGLIERRPHWKKRTEKIFYHLQRHSTLFIMGFRFVYGIRAISPIVIGASGVSIKRFAVLNLIAGVIWAVVSCGAGYGLGYLFADHIEDLYEGLHTYHRYAFWTLIAVITAVVVYFVLKRFMRSRRSTI